MERRLSGEDLYWVWLSAVEGLTARRFYEIVGRYGSAEAVFHQDIEPLRPLLGKQTFLHLQEGRTQAALNALQERINAAGAQVMTRGDEDYPAALAEIYDPPPTLYLLGERRLPAGKSLAVVGSRMCTRYGEDVALMLGDQLARAGVAVVSGLARGVDSFAHKGCLRGKGRAVAVLGTGPDVCYPPENRRLYEEILASGGTVLSEYPPCVGPQKQYFPARNRIIAGMAQGLLLVEAAKGSGAMITVDFAMENGRPVFVVPGPITSLQSSMPNQLMRDGAKPVLDVSDILEELSWGLPPQQLRLEEAQPGLDEDELRVYVCLGDETFTPGEISARLGEPVSFVNTALTRLELRGIIKRAPGNLFRKAR